MKKNKILLLFPPDSDTLKFKDIIFPYGIASIASFLTERGLDAHIYCSGDFRLKTIEEYIKSEEFNIVGISCDSGNRINCFKISESIKSFNKNILIVLGGIHATLFHKQILDKIPSVDFVVRGEGEITLFELISQIRDGGDFTSIKGLSYWKNNKILINQVRPFIKNIDFLPFIKYELFDFQKVKSFVFDPFLVQATRGCPCNCLFCAHVEMWARCYRFKSVPRIIEELRLLKEKYRIKKFSFSDVIPTFDSNWFKAICNAMVKNKLDMKWMCFGKAGTVSKSLLEAMKEAGCDYLLYGIESFSDKMLKIMRKGFNSEMAVKSLNLTQDVGIKASFKLLFGMPGEDKKTLRETLLGFKKLNKGVVCSGINIFEPHPGSPIYHYLKKYNLINDDIWFTDFKMIDYIQRIYQKSLLNDIFKTKKIIENFPLSL